MKLEMNQMGKRGAKPQMGMDLKVECWTSKEVVAALDRLRLMTGLSRATLIRSALTEHLVSAGVLPESARHNVAQAKTSRPTHNNK